MIKKVVLSSLLSLWMATAGAVTGVQAAAPQETQTQTPDLSHLRKWEGHLIHGGEDSVGSEFKKPFWEDPVLKKVIKKVTGKKNYYDEAISNWGGRIVVAPVSIENGVLVAVVAQAHAVPDTFVVFMLDLEENKFFICQSNGEYKNKKTVLTAKGYTEKGPLRLAGNACAYDNYYSTFHQQVRPRFPNKRSFP